MAETVPAAEAAATQDSSPFPSARFQPWGVDLTAIDASVRPGDGFWEYVNGAWAKRTEIAADRTFVGIDSIINDDIDRNLRAIVEGLASDPSPGGTIGQQVGDYYATWMDEAAIEAAGFFIAYGYSWQTKYREGVLRERLLSDEHSPANYRVNGAVRNMDAWYKAFNVQPGDKLYLPPEQRVRVW